MTFVIENIHCEFSLLNKVTIIFMLFFFDFYFDVVTNFFGFVFAVNISITYIYSAFYLNFSESLYFEYIAYR